jgi:hypothetical protein
MALKKVSAPLQAYRVQQFDAFQVCKATVYARIKDGSLKTKKIGKVRLILVPVEEAACSGAERAA